MAKSIISEGRTTTEAIEKGLKELNVSKNMVDIKYIQEEKRSFFSILAPRVVKVELTVKEGVTETSKNNEKQEEPREHKRTAKKEIILLKKNKKKPKGMSKNF